MLSDEPDDELNWAENFHVMMLERSSHSTDSHQIPSAAIATASSSSNCDGDGDGDGDDDHHQHQYNHVHDVPCHASFFEVAAPSMEFTHSDPSMVSPPN